MNFAAARITVLRTNHSPISRDKNKPMWVLKRVSHVTLLCCPELTLGPSLVNFRAALVHWPAPLHMDLVSIGDRRSQET